MSISSSKKFSIILATAVIQLVGRITSFSSDEAVCGLNQTIEFRCLLAPTPPGNPRGFYGFEWKINNVSSISVEGARSNVSSRPPLLLLYCSASLNNSLVQCVRVSLISSTEPPAFGDLHTLHIQGLLESVEDLEISINCTSWSIILTWQPPFSLNITNTDPTITFCVDVYEITDGGTVQLNDSADHWTESHQYTMNISDLNQYQFIVRARNVVGLGAPSAPINATLLPCFDSSNKSLLNATVKICNSHIEVNLSLETSPYPLASGVTVHIRAYNEINCCCSLNDTDGTEFEFHSDNCGCLIPSTNYTICIEYIDHGLVSNRLFVTPTEKCENMTELEPTNISSTIITSTSDHDEVHLNLNVTAVAAAFAGVYLVCMLFTILSCCGFCRYYRKKRSEHNAELEVRFHEDDIYSDFMNPPEEKASSGMTSCSVYDDILPRGLSAPSSDILTENTGNKLQTPYDSVHEAEGAGDCRSQHSPFTQLPTDPPKCFSPNSVHTQDNPVPHASPSNEKVCHTNKDSLSSEGVTYAQLNLSCSSPIIGIIAPEKVIYSDVVPSKLKLDVPPQIPTKQAKKTVPKPTTAADVIEDLVPIADKWSEFAKQIGIDEDLEDEIYTNNEGNVTCLEVTLEFYFERPGNKLEGIIEALENISEMKVADNLKLKYSIS